MKRILAILTLFVLLAPRVSAADLAPADEKYLIHSLAESYPEAGYAVRVGIAAVVLNRTEHRGFPDSAAGVIEGLRREGEFPKSGEADEKLRRITADAVRVAEEGADPTGGALYFHTVRDKTGFDMDFDDEREDEGIKTAMEELADCPVVIDNVGFR